jgi:hypothetical protein
MREEEYSHGFFIPGIAVWLVWLRRDAVLASIGTPSWVGPLLVLVALAMLLVGELSAIFILAQLGFLLALGGLVLAVGGIGLLRVVWVPIAFRLIKIQALDSLGQTAEAEAVFRRLIELFPTCVPSAMPWRVITC